MKHIAAQTETGASKPGYISIAEESGHITVSVRSRGAQTAGVVKLTLGQLQELRRQVDVYLSQFPSLDE